MNILDNWRCNTDNGLYITKKDYKTFCDLDSNYENEFDYTMEDDGFILLFNSTAIGYQECGKDDVISSGHCSNCVGYGCNIINFNKLLRAKKIQSLIHERV